MKAKLLSTGTGDTIETTGVERFIHQKPIDVKPEEGSLSESNDKLKVEKNSSTWKWVCGIAMVAVLAGVFTAMTGCGGNGNNHDEERFIDHENTVYDTQTNLSWAKTGVPHVDWYEAGSYCNDEEMRLPSYIELESLYDPNITDNDEYHLTPLITINTARVWASDRIDSRAGIFNFMYGYRDTSTVDMERYISALCVRHGN